MVSINGVEIRNLRVIPDSDGIIGSGEVYLNNQRLGCWKQNTREQADWFDFDTTVLSKIVERYNESLPENSLIKGLVDVSMFMRKLCQYQMYQQLYEQNFAAGYPVTVVVTDGYNECIVPVQDNNNRKIRKTIKSLKSTLGQVLLSEDDSYLLTFKAMEDFIVTV